MTLNDKSIFNHYFYSLKGCDIEEKDNKDDEIYWIVTSYFPKVKPIKRAIKCHSSNCAIRRIAIRSYKN